MEEGSIEAGAGKRTDNAEGKFASPFHLIVVVAKPIEGHKNQCDGRQDRKAHQANYQARAAELDADEGGVQAAQAMEQSCKSLALPNAELDSDRHPA